MRGAGSRIVGMGSLLRTLRTLRRRVERYNAHRARTHAEHVWARTLADTLDTAYTDALLEPSALLSLQAVDQRAAISQKSRP